MPTAAASASYPATERTTATRSRHRISYDRALVHAVLDEGLLCHLGFVRGGMPVVLPTLYARQDERLYLHASTGSGPALAAGRSGEGLPVCLTVTHLDGLVLARSAFHHSVNFRSVVVHGTAHLVTGEAEKARALEALVEHVVPGRAADCRAPGSRELAATAVLVLDLHEVSAKVREGGPNDEPEDLGLPHWSGVLPVAQAFGAPVAAEGAAPVPGYLTSYRRA